MKSPKSETLQPLDASDLQLDVGNGCLDGISRLRRKGFVSHLVAAAGTLTLIAIKIVVIGSAIRHGSAR